MRRPPAFYAHLLDVEARAASDLPPELQPLLRSQPRGLRAALSGGAAARAPRGGATPPASTRGTAARSGIGLLASAALSQVSLRLRRRDPPRATSSPTGALDADLQQVDLRTRNTWRLTLAEVPTPEMLEVHLVNAVAPFILCSKLKPLMLREPHRRQAHRQRLRDGGHLLARHQDRQAPAHQHGQGRAQHDDAHLGAATT